MEIKKVILTTEEKTVVRKIFTINLVGLILLLLPFLFIVFLLFTVQSFEYKEKVFLAISSVLVLTTLSLPFFYAGDKIKKIHIALKIIQENQKLIVAGKLTNVRNENRNFTYQFETESYSLKPFLGTGFYIHNYDYTSPFDFYCDQEVVLSCLPEMQLLLNMNYPKLEINKEKILTLDGTDIDYLRKNTFNLCKPALGIALLDIVVIAVFYFITDSFIPFMLAIILNVLPFLPNLPIIFKSSISREKVVVSGIITGVFKIDAGYKVNDLIPRRYCVSLGGRLFRCATIEQIVVGERYTIAYVLNKDGSMGGMLGRQNV